MAIQTTKGLTVDANQINQLPSKTTPVDADVLLLEDSAASLAKKKFSIANLKAILKSYFDTIYSTVNFTVTALSTSTTLNSTHSIVTTTGTITITLPTAIGISGKIYTIKKLDGSTQTLTVNTTSSQTIDGQTSLTIRNQYISVQIVSNGSNWLII